MLLDFTEDCRDDPAEDLREIVLVPGLSSWSDAEELACEFADSALVSTLSLSSFPSIFSAAPSDSISLLGEVWSSSLVASLSLIIEYLVSVRLLFDSFCLPSESDSSLSDLFTDVTEPACDDLREDPGLESAWLPALLEEGLDISASEPPSSSPLPDGSSLVAVSILLSGMLLTAISFGKVAISCVLSGRLTSSSAGIPLTISDWREWFDPNWSSAWLREAVEPELARCPASTSCCTESADSAEPGLESSLTASTATACASSAGVAREDLDATDVTDDAEAGRDDSEL